MGERFSAAVVDWARTSADSIRAAPTAFVVPAVIMFAIPCIVLPRLYGARIAALEARLAAQAALVADDRAKLQAAPLQAAGRIAQLTALVTNLKNHLDEEKQKLAALERQRRDMQKLYADSNPIAVVQDPQIDLTAGSVTFRSVTSATLLAANTFYEYRDWKLACGGAQSYSVDDGGDAPQFTYSQLMCRIVGARSNGRRRPALN